MLTSQLALLGTCYLGPRRHHTEVMDDADRRLLELVIGAQNCASACGAWALVVAECQTRDVDKRGDASRHRGIATQEQEKLSSRHEREGVACDGGARRSIAR
jgi:hypothetical protein